MPEIDLTPPEGQIYDGTWKRDTLRAELKRIGLDYRDDPRVARGIEVLAETRISTTTDKKSYTVIDANGEPIRGAFAMKRLAQELAAKIQEDEGPSIEEIMQRKRNSEPYGI